MENLAYDGAHTVGMGEIRVSPPADVMDTLGMIEYADAVILDPWYNRGVGGTIPNYDEWLAGVVDESF